MPAALFYGAGFAPDFVHYSSECLPSFLLALALLLFAGSFSGNRLGYLLACAAILGAVPFAKLQAAPIAAMIGGFALARATVTSASFQAALTRMAMMIAMALLASAIYLLPLALTGGLHDAFLSSIAQPLLRTPPWSEQIVKIALASVMFRVTVATYATMAAAATACVLLGCWRAPHGRAEYSALLRWSFVLSIVLVPTTYASIAYRGLGFAHYLLLAMPALGLAGGVALASIAQSGLSRRWQHACQGALFVIAIAVTVPATARDWDWNHWYYRSQGAFLQGRLFQSPRSLAWLRPTASDSLLCWGWFPSCYVDAAIRPATRESTNENQQYELGLRSYFRSRFISDFNSSNPDFVLDVVAPGSFTFVQPETEGISTFPALAEIIERDFSLASRVEPSGRCPRLYVRKSRLAELNKSRIAFSSIAASAERPEHGAAALDDGSVLETCKDNWLLPEGALGSVTARFSEVSPVRTLAILNTRQGSNNQRVGTGAVRVSIWRGDKSIRTIEFPLQPFPYWTFHRLDAAEEADAIAIEILSFQGTGGGLNEIKVYRD